MPASSSSVPRLSRGPAQVARSPWELGARGRAPLTLTTWLLLSGAAIVVAGSAAPSVLRHMGVTEVNVLASPARPADAPAPFDEDVHRSVRNLEREARAAERDVDPVPALDEEMLHAPRELTLRAEPKVGAKSVGSAKKGSLVLVMREQGPWALVMVPGAEPTDDPTMGWVASESLR